VITVNVKVCRYVVTAHSNVMYTSIDSAVDKIKHQMSKTKERRKEHKGE